MLVTVWLSCSRAWSMSLQVKKYRTLRTPKFLPPPNLVPLYTFSTWVVSERIPRGVCVKIHKQLIKMLLNAFGICKWCSSHLSSMNGTVIHIGGKRFVWDNSLMKKGFRISCKRSNSRRASRFMHLVCRHFSYVGWYILMSKRIRNFHSPTV